MEAAKKSSCKSIAEGVRVGEALNKNVQTRLRRIEGQVQGLQRMIDSGRDCEEMLTQIMAVRSSIDQVGILLMENHIEHCILDGLPDDSALFRDLSVAL
jgi:DNA-binding FrmR family transcriptional regulator